MVYNDAYIDTGSRYTYLQRKFLHQIDAGPCVHVGKHHWSGSSYRLAFHEVVLEISESLLPGKTWFWPAVIGFTAAPLPYRAVLGQVGFFQFFRVLFDFQGATVEVSANQVFDAVGQKI